MQVTIRADESNVRQGQIEINEIPNIPESYLC